MFSASADLWWASAMFFVSLSAVFHSHSFWSASSRLLINIYCFWWASASFWLAYLDSLLHGFWSASPRFSINLYKFFDQLLQVFNQLLQCVWSSSKKVSDWVYYYFLKVMDKHSQCFFLHISNVFDQLLQYFSSVATSFLVIFLKYFISFSKVVWSVSPMFLIIF